MTNISTTHARRKTEHRPLLNMTVRLISTLAAMARLETLGASSGIIDHRGIYAITPTCRRSPAVWATHSFVGIRSLLRNDAAAMSIAGTMVWRAAGAAARAD